MTDLLLKSNAPSTGETPFAFRLSPFAFRLSPFAFRLSPFAFRLSPLVVFGLWSLVFGLWSLVFGLWSLVFGLWSLVFGLWSLVFGLWSLVFGLSQLVLRLFPPYQAEVHGRAPLLSRTFINWPQKTSNFIHICRPVFAYPNGSLARTLTSRLKVCHKILDSLECSCILSSYPTRRRLLELNNPELIGNHLLRLLPFLA
ncbi:hypothetical protein GCWU000246_01223 [Jonquetella anthropi E3_33 E1]|nr:hypothetical protein GCWU000246_01223 [Jonquetella anthropi E3_33 E1]